MISLIRKCNNKNKHKRNYYVYKSADNYIIKLDIDKKDKNNLGRKVYDKNYATYLTNKAYVVRIYNKFNSREVDHIRSDYNPDFIYSIYEYVNDNKGISFYLTEEAAFHHNLDTYNYTGEHKQWYQDGVLFYKINYVKGIKHGKFQTFFPNEKLGFECNYDNDILKYDIL